MADILRAENRCFVLCVDSEGFGNGVWIFVVRRGFESDSLALVQVVGSLVTLGISSCPPSGLVDSRSLSLFGR